MSIKDNLLKADIKEIVKTPRGKGIAAGLLLLLLLLIVLVIVTVALPKPANEVIKNVAKPVAPQPAPAPTAQPQDTDTADTDTDTLVTEYDLFEYKDPFKPLSIASIDNGLTTDDLISGNTDGDSREGDSEDNSDIRSSISLTNILEQNDIKYAIVLYRGQEYTVKEGDQVGDSPFQVTDISDNSISLLYGDDKLTLRLGEEIVK